MSVLAPASRRVAAAAAAASPPPITTSEVVMAAGCHRLLRGEGRDGALGRDGATFRSARDGGGPPRYRAVSGRYLTRISKDGVLTNMSPEPPSRPFAGLDIGGSKVLAVAADAEGRVLASVRLATRPGAQG